MKTKREGRKEGGRDSEIEDKETRREGRKEGRMDRGGWVCVSGGGGGGPISVLQTNLSPVLMVAVTDNTERFSPCFSTAAKLDTQDIKFHTTAILTPGWSVWILSSNFSCIQENSWSCQ